MGGRALSRGNPSPFLAGLVELRAGSAAACFSRDADELCVPVGLFSLSALLSLLSCVLLVCQRCRCRGGNPREAGAFLYSLLGNLCSTAGAVLSRQLHIQIIIGAFAAAVDAVQFVSCCIPVLLCWNSKAERRLRMMRWRRRQHLLAVCVLMVVAGGFLQSRVAHSPAGRPLSGRRLLHFAIQDNTEILGYILGLLSFVISCTSRFPALCRAYRGQILTRAHMFSGLLCSLAGALHAAALLLYNTQFGFILFVMPWLLSAICSGTLDLLILVVHWCKRGTRQQLTSFSPDTESLLGGSGIPAEDNTVKKRQRNKQGHSSAQTKTKNGQKMTEMGHYMDVRDQPAKKICLKEVTSKEDMEDRPLNRTVRVIRVNSLCSSDTSYDSSLVGSDLEWDFEEANAQWSEATAKQPKGNGFPLRLWTTNPEPCNICTGAMSRLPQKTLPGTDEGEGVSSANLAK